MRVLIYIEGKTINKALIGRLLKATFLMSFETCPPMQNATFLIMISPKFLG